VKYILLGGGGLLGSGFRAILDRRGDDYVRLHPPWRSRRELAHVIKSDLRALLCAEGPSTLIWAAGVGHVGASADDLAAETAGIAAAADALRDLGSSSSTTILFASSGGGLFAGVDVLIDDHTEPSPIAPYGREKLRQEELLRRVANETGARIVACRMSNLYGLASGHLRARGLIGTAVRCSRLRQPMRIIVSPDTRRDYLLNDDAAAIALHHGARARQGFSTALIREGRTRTIVEVLSLVGTITRRRVPVVFAQTAESPLQPRALRFSAPVLHDDTRLTPMEAGIARMAMAPLAN